MINRFTRTYLRRMLLLFLWMAFSGTLLAQERTVSGSIKDVNGTGLAGVTVLVKNTTTGTNTDLEGKYSLSVGKDAVLLFSFIGYQTQEVAVGNQSVIDIILKEDIKQLGEVVVTALGIERSTKALQSSITKVPGVSLTSARENNFGAAIQGRVAGVNVVKASTGPAGSSRVTIRGNKSLGGSNQPLYVVDGIPMDNTNFGQAGLWGGSDRGDGLSSINPDDIESITVLKGANAAALYGSRGGNGVINITTKSGTARKGIGVEFNSNFVMEKVINYLDLQSEYGEGGLANSDPADPNSPRIGSKPANQEQAWNFTGWSWGSKLDGDSTISWDGIKRPYSYVGDKNNFNSFFQTGNTWTNSLALTGGSDKQTFRFSFSDMKNSAVIPVSHFNRMNISLSTNGKFGKKITFGAKVLYSNEDSKNRPMVSDLPGNASQCLILLCPNFDVNDLLGDPNKPGAVPEGTKTIDGKIAGEEFFSYQNPWWNAYQFINSDIRDRIISSGSLRFNITRYLYIQGKLGMDWYVKKTKSLWPQGDSWIPGGSANEGETQVREVNQEWTLGFDKIFEKIGVNAFLGGNKMTNMNEHVGANGSAFNIPYFTSVNNTSSQNFEYWYGKYGINSLFASAEISYGGYLFLTGTARNDWFSLLNPANNHKLYPSVGASWVFTDEFKNLPSVLSFGKVRASWGQVATANVPTYGVNLTYSLYGQGHLGRPMADYSTGTNIPNPNLVPALSTEIEFGTELRFLLDRIGIDFTYYDQKTTDDILQSAISIGSGFQTTSMNIGELTNKGVEILLTGTPVKGPLTWEISFNLAKNNSKVIELSPGINQLFIEEPRTRTVAVKQIVGYPYGMLMGLVQKTDDAGNKMFDSQGSPVGSDFYEILGKGVPDFTGGLNNSFTWKQFSLSFLLDFKSGGKIYSGTNVRLVQYGLSKESLQGRDGTMKVTGVFDDGTGNYSDVETRTLTIEQANNYWVNLGDRDQSHFVYDASFLKLRQLTFGYDLPNKILAKTPMKTLNLSLVARNLWCIIKHTPNIDPESTYTSSAGQGLDYFGLPASRTYGFNLRVTF